MENNMVNEMKQVDAISFENDEFGKVRTVMVENEPWFVAADVCKVLGIVNTSAAMNRIDQSDKQHRMVQGTKGCHETNVVNKNGVCVLVGKSKKRIASKFLKWILKEISRIAVVDTNEMPASLSKDVLMEYTNDLFGSIKVVIQNGEPWFVGKEIAEKLGYTNPSKALIDHVDESDKRNNDPLMPLSQCAGWLINEPGLYSLIMSSKLPSAALFKRWVMKDVLPSIRKTGGYIHHAEEMSDMEIIHNALKIAERVIKQRDAQAAADKKKIEDLTNRVNMLENDVFKWDARKFITSVIRKYAGSLKHLEDYTYQSAYAWKVFRSEMNSTCGVNVASRLTNAKQNGKNVSTLDCLDENELVAGARMMIGFCRKHHIDISDEILHVDGIITEAA